MAHSHRWLVIEETEDDFGNDDSLKWCHGCGCLYWGGNVMKPNDTEKLKQVARNLLQATSTACYDGVEMWSAWTALQAATDRL